MMMVSAAPSPSPLEPARLMFTSVTSVPDMSLTVILSAPPRALKSIDSMSFRSMTTLATSRVNSARSPFAEIVDLLGDVGAVEQHRVEAVLALEGVVVVTRVPDEGVVAGTHQGGVVAVAAVDEVVAFAADEEVVAEAAVHRQLDAVGLEAARH